MPREPYEPPMVTQLDPTKILESVLENARKANQIVAELELMIDSLNGKAAQISAKVDELQGIIDSSVREMRRLEAFKRILVEAGDPAPNRFYRR